MKIKKDYNFVERKGFRHNNKYAADIPRLMQNDIKKEESE